MSPDTHASTRTSTCTHTVLSEHTFQITPIENNSKVISSLSALPLHSHPFPPFLTSQRISGRRQLSCFLKKKCDALRRSTLRLTGYQRDGEEEGGGTRREPVENCADTSYFLSSSVSPSFLYLIPLTRAYPRTHPCTVSL